MRKADVAVPKSVNKAPSARLKCMVARASKCALVFGLIFSTLAAVGGTAVLWWFSYRPLGAKFFLFFGAFFFVAPVIGLLASFGIYHLILCRQTRICQQSTGT
jgi:hypothetical protein